MIKDRITSPEGYQEKSKPDGRQMMVICGGNARLCFLHLMCYSLD